MAAPRGPRKRKRPRNGTGSYRRPRRICFICNEEEDHAVKLMAAARGHRSVSEYIRALLDQDAQRALH